MNDPERRAPALNVETPLAALAAPVTPTEAFFRRSNFAIPEIAADDWSLAVEGAVRQPLVLDGDALRRLPPHAATVTIECAGNGRGGVRPLPPGEPWGLGAVGTARFAGARLRDVLHRAGPRADAVEVLFAGADSGVVETRRTVRFERSMPLADALHPDVLLAWEMNGAPLPARHGFPLRLVVPGWYGVASVKWLTEIRVLRAPFDGHFQRERYVYRGEAGTAEGTPVARMRVRAVIAAPTAGERLTAGVPVTIRGAAWSGEAPVRAVHVSVDGGATWRPARLTPPPSPHAAAGWEIAWTPEAAGRHVLVARAADEAGRVQPMEPVWNELGYGNNAVQRLEVEVG